MIERHFTVTTYVVQDKRALLIFHPKMQKWLPPGGHIEPNEIPHEAALREVLEETGLHVELIQQENLWINCWNAASIPRPYFCLLENIPPHPPHPAHQHIDLIYLAKPTGEGILHQSHGARWFTLDEILALSPDETIFGETQQTLSHLLGTI
jgi:ADP-ribose pyrophosphatase YjhB (NUDIX family)